MTRMVWGIFGCLLLFLAPASRAAAQGKPEESPLDKKVARALQNAGLATGPEDVGCTHPINSFNFTSVPKLFDELNPIRAKLTGTYDNTVMGVRVVLGQPGGNGSVPALGSKPLGGAGGAVVLALGNNNLVLAIGGNGGDGANGDFDHAEPKILVEGNYTGGAGGAGGAVTIACVDENSVAAFGGDGGNGGNQGALAGKHNGPLGGPGEPAIKGNNGSGGAGGASSVTFNECNSITVQAGDGGLAGIQGLVVGPAPIPGKGGNGGDATATSPTPPNAGRVEAGFGRAPLGVNGTAARNGAGAASLVVTAPAPGP